MTSAPGTPGSPHADALAQIRAAEAARVIGLLDDGLLVSRAPGWAVAGVESAALADLLAADTASDRAASLAHVAADVDVHFATTSEARSEHALTVIDTMTKSGDLVADVMRFSNNYTDEVSGKLRGTFDRLFRKRS